MRKQLAAIIVGTVVLGACASKKPVKVDSGPGTPQALKALVDQRLLLRSFGDRRDVVLKPGKELKGTCDVAVLVTSAQPVDAGARFTLRSLGRVRLGDAPTSGPCKELAPQIGLTLTGSLAQTPEQWLLTPEAYLTAHGKTIFSATPQPAPKLAADSRANAGDEERRLGRRVTVWPKPLLAVEPAFSGGASKVKHEGEIQFDVIVGADGRLFEPRVRTALADEQEKNVLQVLDLWRFEPARDDKAPVPARYDGRTVLRIY
jgi:hypothetical protein